jgi:peptide subunit release factor 1 (eRF1)
MQTITVKRAVFSGNSVLLIPPKRLTKAIYRCDTKFYLHLLTEMFEDEIKYGVLMVSGKGYSIQTCCQTGTHFDFKTVINEDIYQPNKHNKGGQSSVRFARIRNIVHNHYVDQMACDVVESLMINNHTKCIVDKLIVCGNASMKNEVVNTQWFQQHLSKYLVKVITTSGDTLDHAKCALLSCIDELSQNDLTRVDNELDIMISTVYDMLAFGLTECSECINEKNVTKVYLNKININEHMLNMLYELRLTLNIQLFFTTSNKLKAFGDIICVKKYSTH